MDNFTHTLSGLALSRAGLGRASKGAAAALLIASNLPDIDLVSALQGSAAYLEHHRGVSHSVLGAPLLALGLAVAIRLLVRGSRLLPLLACALAGVAGHVFMDLWTSYGTRVLSPFDRRWLTWDLVFIVDPWILAILLVAVLWRRAGAEAPHIASAGLGLVLAYVGGRAVLHRQALDQGLARLPAQSTVVRAAALPSPLDPFRWRVIADTKDAYWSGDIDLRGTSPPLSRREKAREDETVARVKQASPVASVFLDFSPFPWLEVQRSAEGVAVVWRDLRFEARGRNRFVTRVVVGADGRIRSESFAF